jgi:hypothetical protein
MIAPEQSLRMIPFGMNAENVQVDAGGRLRVVAAGSAPEPNLITVFAITRYPRT